MNDSTNDINASSEFSLDGTVQINTPDLDLQRELEPKELELVTADSAIANSCLARNDSQANLNLGGTNGFPRSTKSNYSDANFSLTGVSSPPTTNQSSAVPEDEAKQNYSTIPAEKIVETESGRIFLVAAPQKAESLFCQSVSEQER